MKHDSHIFAVVGPLKVSDILATQPDIIHGYPMPTAVAGLGYKLWLDLKKQIEVCEFALEGTAVVVHEHSEMEGHSKHPAPDRDPTKGAAIVDEVRARATLSFILKLSYDDGGDERAEDAFKVDVVKALTDLVPGIWFSGGKAFPVVGKPISDHVALGEPGQLSDLVKALPAGFFLVDRRDVLTELAAEYPEDDRLDTVLRIVERLPKLAEGAKEPTYERLMPGWIVPITAGFQGIEVPRLRAPRRLAGGEAKHSYVESIYSIGEYRSSRSLAASDGDEAFEAVFWKHCRNAETQTYYVSATGPF